MLLILLLISISLLPLYSQADTAENGSEVASLDEMRNAIEEERISRVNQLLASNNISEIEELFASDEQDYFTLLKDNDTQYASFIRELMFKAYRNVASLQDDLLFIDCKKATYSQDWDMVALKANDLLKRYPDSNRKTIALRYWKLALFKSGKDQEYVNLVEEYPEFEVSTQKFQYGQALYNIGRSDDALNYLEEAALDDRYTLRATATLGLIELSKGNVDSAVMIFELLQNNFSPDTPYYDFVLLSIARLFSHFGDPETAISYYQAYSQLNNDNISEVIYEIGIAHRNAGNLEKAKKAFERLLETKFADDYYVQTLYNLILIDQELNNGQAANQLMSDYQARVDDYFESLLKNRNLMNEIRTLRNNYLMENEQSRKEIIKEQITAKEEEILQNQLALDEKISFLDARSLQLIKELELTLIERTETYFIELDLIEQYRNRPKDELISIVNRDRANKEEDYLLNITEELLSDIDSPNDDQFLRAYWYANQLYLKRKYLVNVSNLIEKTRAYPEKNAELRELLREENENLDEIKVKAKFDLAEFPNLSEKQDLADQKVDEFLAAESKLEVKRKKVIDTYYEKMADKAQEEVVDKFKDLDQKINIYANSFNKFNNIKNEQKTYVDFIELDLSYRKLNDSYKARLEQADRESVALTEAELKEFSDQYEIIYNRINRFIFQNNQFKNNFQLYYDMAEIATIIYSNNYNLIYNNYSKVLELNPDYPQKDIILYNLAYYKNQILDFEIANLKEEKMKDEDYFYQPRPVEVTKTVAKYDEVIKNYLELSKDVTSKYQIESMLRLAKLYWDIAVDADDTEKYITYSIKIYDQIYSIGNRDQKYEALFQRAWHKMALQKYSEALADLELLLVNKDLFTEYQQNKYSAAEDIIVYSLNAIDVNPEEETKSYTYVENKLYTLYDEETADNVFQKLLDKKRVFDEYEQIIKLYDAKRKIDPYAIDNPLYIDSIIVTMSFYSVELGDSLDARGEREYLKAIEKYGYGSDWYEYNKTNDLAPFVKVVQKGLDDMIIPDLYNKVIENPTLENIENFSQVIDEYAKYVGFDEEIRQKNLTIYEKNSISASVKYVITKQDTSAYNYGIDQVYSFIENNPDSEIRKDLEQNGYSWAYNITVITDTTKFDSLQFTEQQIEDKKNNSKRQYINIADRYYDFLASSDIPNKDETMHSLLFYRGMAKYRMGNNEGAKEDFLACNDLDISDEFKEGIFRNLAEIYKEDGDLDASIEYYAKAKEFVDDEKKVEYEKEIFNNRSAKISKLNSSENQEDKVRAAQEMEKAMNSSAIDDERKAELRRNAIELYAAGGDYETAINRLIQEGDNNTNIEAAWNNYGAAITLADSLGYDTRVQDIEDLFMNRFPNDQQTFAILVKRLSTVQDSTLATYDPLLAAEKMREIYDRATQDGDRLDISSLELTAEDYYFNSVEFKCRTLSKEQQVQEWIAFNQEFPDYERVAILNKICQLFEDTGNDEKYLEYIKVLYAADNSNVRYPTYAVEQLSAINDKINKAYRSKDWNSMLALIEDFKEQANVFTSDGIPAENIAVPASLERYARYTTEYEREQEKKAFIADLEDRFENFMDFIDVPADASDRIKVNNATTWNAHLSGNDKRINNFDALVKKQFELIDQDADRVLASDLLSVEEKREQIYNLDFAKFKIAEYAGDLIYKQINQFLNLPNGQYINYANIVYSRTDLTFEEQDQVLIDYDNDIYNTRQQYVNEFDAIGIGYAKSIYDMYIDGITNPLPRTDEVITYLQKVGVSEIAPKEEINFAFETSWRKDFSPITETVINDGYRDFMVYTIEGGDSLHIETNIECPILPMAARMRFVDEGDFWANDQVDFSFEVNGNNISVSELLLPDGVVDDSLSTFPYLYRSLFNDNNLSSLNYQKGPNSFTITVVNNSYDTVNIGLNFSMLYDQEKLFIHNNAIETNIVSDNSWLGADSLQTLDISDPNWGQVKYGNIDVDYYQLNAFKNSVAVPIWFSSEQASQELAETPDSLQNISLTVNQDSLDVAGIDNDTLQVASLNDTLSIEEETVTEDQPTVKYFIKEFNLSGQVIDGIVHFLANETANIYLNGEQVGYDEYYYFAPPDAPYLDISPEYFVQGKNVIIFEVNSPTQNNGLLLDLQIRTLSEGR